jgi:hypothetical protein
VLAAMAMEKNAIGPFITGNDRQMDGAQLIWFGFN